MSLASDLYTVLTGDAGVAALIGTRLYPDVAPPGAALPRATYQFIDRHALQHFNGRVSEVLIADLQIDCWGVSSPERDSVADAIELVLDGVVQTEWTDVYLQSSRMESRVDSYEEPGDGSAVGLYRALMQFTLVYRMN
jgi:hypothetical protein